MKRKYSFLFLAFVIALATIFPSGIVLASEPWEKIPHLEPGRTVTIITDSAELVRLSSEIDPSIPDGYELTEVIITNVVFPVNRLNDTGFSARTDSTVEPFWGPKWEIKNYRKDSYQIIYPDNPIRNSLFPGPSTATMTVSEAATSTFSASTGVSLSLVEAKIGHSISQSVTVSDSISVPVPSGKTLQIKAFILYDQWRMDVYKDNKFVGTEFYHYPVGISFKQYLFQSK